METTKKRLSHACFSREEDRLRRKIKYYVIKIFCAIPQHLCKFSSNEQNSFEEIVKCLPYQESLASPKFPPKISGKV